MIVNLAGHHDLVGRGLLHHGLKLLPNGIPRTHQGIGKSLVEAGLLDRLMLSVAPVTLGAGRPLLPRPFDLRLVDLAQNGAFACLTYDVVGPLQRGPDDPGNL